MKSNLIMAILLSHSRSAEFKGAKTFVSHSLGSLVVKPVQLSRFLLFMII